MVIRRGPAFEQPQLAQHGRGRGARAPRTAEAVAALPAAGKGVLRTASGPRPSSYRLRNNSLIDPTIGYFFARRSAFSASRRMDKRSLGFFRERPDLPCLRIPMPELPFIPVTLRLRVPGTAALAS